MQPALSTEPERRAAPLLEPSARSSSLIPLPPTSGVPDPGKTFPSPSPLPEEAGRSIH